MSNKQIFAAITVLLALFWIGVLAAVVHFVSPNEVRYDCSMAEFHPDFPPKAREKCRMIRSHKL